MELKQGSHAGLLLWSECSFFFFFHSYPSALIHHFLFCSSWVLILLLPHSFVLIFYPRLHPLHVFSPPTLFRSSTGLQRSHAFFFLLCDCYPSVLTSLRAFFPPHSIPLFYFMPLTYVTCAVCRLPRFLQQSAQSGTSSALGVPRTPHRSHLWRTCLPQ